MRFSTLAFALLPLTVQANSSSGGPSTCYTITAINSPPCATPSPCTVPLCEAFSTITQSCGCASIYTTNICQTACPTGRCAGTSYNVIQLPCATSMSSPKPSSGTTSGYPTTSVIYGNTTTVTTVETLTTCPASCTCSGQTTVWTGTGGPSTCEKKTCSVVLPGGGTTTVTGVTVKTGPTPTGSASKTAAPTTLQSSGGERVREGGWIAAVAGVLAFL